ncbi:MAG TPA: hypothetical protein VII85_02520 [Candidatus Krumholzibacteriaceae bacterium]
MAERIGVYVCHCGTNIAGKVNIDEVVNFAKGLEGVALVRDYKFMCSDPGQAMIEKDITEGKIDRVVVASCSPLMHENTFRKVCERSGVNAYLFAMANIREQCSWVHLDGAASTEKAKALIAGAVRRSISPRRGKRSSLWSARRRSAATWRNSTRPSRRSTAPRAFSRPAWFRWGSTRTSRSSPTRKWPR